MVTKQEIMERLAAVPTQNILHLLRDETIFEIASKFFQPANETKESLAPPTNTGIINLQNTISAKSGSRAPIKAANDRAKRPLNAFMAFRSYYLKLFPEVQQKAASGFLTTLWNKDPCRNKWTLIAKVYSSVRDEVGKGNISLTGFLETSCPIMEILAPSVYLKTLGWTVGESENGLKKLIKDDTEIPNIESSPICPKTELELLQALITIGYMPENGDILAERMKTSNDGLMTTLASPPCNNLKTSPPSPPLSDSPTQPTPAPPSTAPPSYSYPEKTLLSLHPLPESFYEYIPSIPSFSTPTSYDYAASTSTQTTPPSSAPPPSAPPSQHQQVPLQQADTDADANAAILRFETIFDHEAFDIDSPWDVNVVLGYTTMPLANSNAEYDAREDFHFAF